MLVSEITEKNRIGIYKQLDNRNPFQSVVWSAMLGNTESSHFERLFAETIEENSGYQLTRRSMALREVVCQLSELAWDLKYCANLAGLFQDESIYQQFTYLKFLVDDIFESWSGGRELPRLICLGGVRKDLKLGDQKYLLTNLKLIEEELVKTIEYILCDRLIKENLDDIGRDFPEDLASQILWWPELFSRERAVDWIAPGKFLSFYEKSLAEESLENKDYFDAFALFRYRVFRLVQTIYGIRKSLNNLPDGDFRVVVEHLHIPGNNFLSQILSSPTGKIYSYYCSGKYRVSSFSKLFLNRIRSSGYDADERMEAWVKVLGVDLVQGVNCESVD